MLDCFCFQFKTLSAFRGDGRREGHLVQRREEVGGPEAVCNGAMFVHAQTLPAQVWLGTEED